MLGLSRVSDLLDRDVSHSLCQRVGWAQETAIYVEWWNASLDNVAQEGGSPSLPSTYQELQRLRFHHIPIPGFEETLCRSSTSWGEGKLKER